MTLVFASKSSVPPPAEANSQLGVELANSPLNIISGSLSTCKLKEDRTFVYAGLVLLFIAYCELTKSALGYVALDTRTLLIKIGLKKRYFLQTHKIINTFSF